MKLKSILFIGLMAFIMTACSNATDNTNESDGAARPTAEPGTGKYIQGQKITLETTTPGPGVEIRYTTNGTTPTGSSTLYTAPITLSSNITLKAIAIKSGLNNSAVLEVAYTVIPLDMVSITAGTSFQMGSPAGEIGSFSNETQHSVTLSKNFNMGKYQVTQEQYECVMGTNPSYFHGGTGSAPATGEVQAKRPVENVRWYEALVFCNKLSMATGLNPVYKISGSTNPDDWGQVPTSSDATWNAVIADWNANGYRLPTEAEWEYACRAGKTTAFNNGTDDWNSFPDTLGWYYGNSNTNMTYKGTHEVGKKIPNTWGLHDMHGNVYEWCWDRYGESYYSSSPSSDPTGPETGAGRVIRGGSWDYGAQYLRSACRSYDTPSGRFAYLGFRLLRL